MAYSLDRQVNAYGQVYYRHNYYTPKPKKAVLAQVVTGFQGKPFGQGAMVQVQAGALVWAEWAEGSDLVNVYPGDARYIGGYERAEDGKPIWKPMLVVSKAQAREWLKSYPATVQTAPTRPTIYKGQLPQEVK